ncbi:hypothetical protein ACFQH8_00770 [Halomicroarcula sp. GCM10025710]
MSADATVIELDVRTIDGEPFPEIASALKPSTARRRSGSSAPSSRCPLRRAGSTGFTYETERVDTDTWHVTIRRE